MCVMDLKRTEHERKCEEVKDERVMGSKGKEKVVVKRVSLRKVVYMY